jgi:multidrug efflux pump subunit AcrB
MDVEEKNMTRKGLIRLSILLVGVGLFFMLISASTRGFGSFMITVAALFWLYRYFIKGLAQKFQQFFLNNLERNYEKLLQFAMRGWRAYAFVFGTIALLITSFILVGIASPKVEFFPDNEPSQIIVYIEYPQGTDIDKTNSITKGIEQVVIETVNNEKYMDEGANFMVESLVSQVGEGAGNPQTDGGSQAEMPHRGKITATMREYKFRRGLSSEVLRSEVQQALQGKFSGVSISVEKDANGPPVGYPVNIEISGDNYIELIKVANDVRSFIIKENIPWHRRVKSRCKPQQAWHGGYS